MYYIYIYIKHYCIFNYQNKIYLYMGILNVRYVVHLYTYIYTHLHTHIHTNTYMSNFHLVNKHLYYYVFYAYL